MEEEEGAVEKYHNMEGVQLKKGKKSSFLLLFYAGLISSFLLYFTLKTKGNTKISWNHEAVQLTVEK